MLYAVLGIVIALVLHVVFLRITTWATDQEFKENFWRYMFAVVYFVRFWLWATWLALAARTNHPTFVAMAVIGPVIISVWSMLQEDMSDNEIKQSSFFSWLDRFKLLPWCYNRLR